MSMAILINKKAMNMHEKQIGEDDLLRPFATEMRAHSVEFCEARSLLCVLAFVGAECTQDIQMMRKF